MHLFRVRLILALIASVTLVSLGSTYFEVLSHRHSLREDLERRTTLTGLSIVPDVRSALSTADPSALPDLAQLLKNGTGALGLAIYNAHGNLLAGSGPPDVMGALGRGVVEKSLQRGVEAGAFGHAGQRQWLLEAFPIQNGTQLQGALAIVVDAGYIRSEGIALWQRSFLRIVAFVIVIVAITLLMVRWFLLGPMTREP
jgi:trehalose 6-phosphate synthase